MFINQSQFNENDNDKNGKLLNAVHRYLALINRISQGEAFPAQEVAKNIIADDCRKIFNGKPYTKNREVFIEDLLKVNRTQGCWKVSPVDIISSPQEMSVVLRLMIDMEKVGIFTAIVILRFDSKYLISEINEVLSRVQDAYDF